MTKNIDGDWELRESGFHYRVEGDVPPDVLVKFEVPLKDLPAVDITANPVVNAVPYVCETTRGLRQTSELPMLIPSSDPRER